MKWLSKFLALTEGIPKHDVYRRVLCAIKSELLEACFMDWVRDIKQDIKREVIAIDGKTVRGMATKSRFKAGTEAKPIHLVSAWATENQLVFAQVQTGEKRNEITAIPAPSVILPTWYRMPLSAHRNPADSPAQPPLTDCG
jgi:hypothetical protein